MVKVVIDARMVGAVAHGIARYTAQIARALSSRKLTYEPIFLVNENFSVSSFYGFEIHRVPAAFLSPKEWFEIPKALKKISPALYHSTGFSALPYCPVPTVISIHDLNHLRFGNRMQKAYYQWVLKPFAVSGYIKIVAFTTQICAVIKLNIMGRVRRVIGTNAQRRQHILNPIDYGKTGRLECHPPTANRAVCGIQST